MVNLSKFKHGLAITKSWKTVHWMLGPNLPCVTTSGTWLADGGMRWFCSHSLLGWKVTPRISPLVFCFTLRKTGKVHSASVCTSWDYIPNFHRGRKELLFSCLSYEEVTVAYKKKWAETKQTQVFRGENNEENIVHTPSQLHLSNNIVTSCVFYLLQSQTHRKRDEDNCSVQKT